MHRAAHRESDVAKIGNLRAGNSGIMSAEGDVAGSCHRLAHLRQLGVEVEVPDDSKLIMFQMGTANEEVVYQDLLHTSGEDEIILREEQIPTLWFTENGTKVTGRPDMVICKVVDIEDVPEGVRHYEIPATEPVYNYFGKVAIPSWGVELKSIASVWTTREVMGDGKPKLEHLVQAAHYSWQLGIPFRLMYKQYSNQAMPGFGEKFFPKQGEPGSEHISYDDRGGVKNVNPFEIVYELQFSGSGYLEYRREGDGTVPAGDWVRTLVRRHDIERFYEFVSRMEEDKALGPRFLTIGADGTEKSTSRCTYCPIRPICDKVDKGRKGVERMSYDEWIAAVREYTGTTT